MGFKSGCIAVTLGAVIGVGGVVGLGYIKDMKVEANFQETVENIEESENNLNVIVDALKSEMNKHLSYPVSFSSATFKNFNVYKEDVKYAKNIFTGEILKKPFSDGKDWITSEPTISTYAQADSKFTHMANMSKLEYVPVENNKLIVRINIKDVFLDNKSVALDMLTYKSLEAETIDGKTYKNSVNGDAQLLEMDQNMEKNKVNSMRANAQRAWEVKYIEDAPEKINELYSVNEEKKAELINNTKESIKTLMDTILVNVVKSLDVVNEDLEVEVEVQI